MFLKNRNIISKIKRSKVTDYAALMKHSYMDGSRASLVTESVLVFCYYIYQQIAGGEFSDLSIIGARGR